VRIRLEGTREECQQAAPLLAHVVNVVSVSQPYPNRGQGRLVRVYLEVRLDPECAAAPPAPERPRATIRRGGRELPAP